MAKSRRKPKVKRLPGNHAIARYCGGSTIEDDGSVSSAAFLTRNKDEGKLSVVSVECAVAADPSTTRQESVIRNLSRTLTLGPEGVIVELSVSAVRRIRYKRRRLKAEWDADPRNHCHCAIHIWAVWELAFAERLARIVNRAAAARYPATV